MKECVLPDDQTSTLTGHWKVAPVPIAFRTGQFDATEMQDIVKAAAAWNRFSMASLGINILDVGDATNPRTSSAPKPASSQVCSIGIVSGSEFTGPVVLYKQGAWPYAHDVIALTSSCPMIPDTPVMAMSMAVMEVNYEDFFVAGKKIPDLTSIFVHEFGHLLGLDHSCDTKKAGFPNCNDATLPDAYFQAAMFPVVLFDSSGMGELRRTTRSNDQGRANCLYENLRTTSN